jgi:hypothetical protein
MKRTFTITGLTLVILTASHLAFGTTKKYVVDPNFALGVGHHLCKTWITDRQEAGEAYEMDKSWLNGFISGYNEYGKSKVRFLAFINGSWQDESTLPSGINNACEQHPEELVEEVTIKFLDGIVKYHNEATRPRP